MFEQRLAHDEFALRGALESLAVRFVSLDPKQLANVNSREDLASLEASLEGRVPR
ncbi:MAG: hypothetical protein H0V07_13755 [Propionibacteriales bacterium]|nr:hypothetical protein [Propionibacteriales bacterium]